MIWDKIVNIEGVRIGILFFKGKDAKERAQAVMNSMKLNPSKIEIIESHEIILIIGPADNK